MAGNKGWALGSGLVLQRAGPKETFFLLSICGMFGVQGVCSPERVLVFPSFVRLRSTEADFVVRKRHLENGPTLELSAAGQVNGRPRCFACCTRSITSGILKQESCRDRRWGLFLVQGLLPVSLRERIWTVTDWFEFCGPSFVVRDNYHYSQWLLTGPRLLFSSTIITLQ